ncbi:MFS transporter [Kribbella sp. NPDC055071]
MSRQPQPAKLMRSPWRVVGGAGLAQAVSLGPLVLSTFSLFVIPIAAETGWNRATVTVAFTVMGVGFALGTPIVGQLLDRFAFRLIVVPAYLLYTLCLASIHLAPRSLPLFYVPFFFVGLFASGTFIPFSKAVLSWFDNKRGRAIGFTAALGALGAILTPLLASALIETVGWRAAYPWMALIALLLSISMVLSFVRVRAERSVRGRLVSRAADADRAVSLEVPGLTLREAFKGKQLWIIGGVLCVAGIAVIGIQVNVVPMMTDQGMHRNQAALLLTIYGVASLLGRFAGGFLLDRFHAPRIAAAILLCPVAGMLLLHRPFASAAAGIALVGLAFGMEIDLLAFLTSRYLGMRRFGSLLGILQSAVLFSTAFGPLLIGIGYETTGTYTGFMPYVGGALVLSAVVVLLLGPYRYPPVAGFDRTAAQDELAAAQKLADLASTERPATPHTEPIPTETR